MRTIPNIHRGYESALASLMIKIPQILAFMLLAGVSTKAQDLNLVCITNSTFTSLMLPNAGDNVVTVPGGGTRDFWVALTVNLPAPLGSMTTVPLPQDLISNVLLPPSGTVCAYLASITVSANFTFYAVPVVEAQGLLSTSGIGLYKNPNTISGNRLVAHTGNLQFPVAPIGPPVAITAWIYPGSSATVAGQNPSLAVTTKYIGSYQAALAQLGSALPDPPPTSGDVNIGAYAGISINQSSTATWMNQLIKAYPAVTLQNITMPGSHDAGMYLTPTCAESSSSWAQAQGMTILNQLQAGVRYFDLRPYAMVQAVIPSSNSPLLLGVAHFGGPGLGCVGDALATILQDVNTFLTQNSGEVVFLNFSHTQQAIPARILVTSSCTANWLCSQTGQSSPFTISFPVPYAGFNSPLMSPPVVPTMGSTISNFVLTQLGKNVYVPATGASTNLLVTPLKHMQGKAVVMFDAGDSAIYSPLPDTASGVFLSQDCNALVSQCNPATIPSSNLSVFNSYSNTSDGPTMISNQLYIDSVSTFGNPSYLLLVSWTLTAQGPTNLDIQSNAQLANNYLPQLNGLVMSKTLPQPAIVFYDFVNQNLNWMILNMNSLSHP